MFGHQDVTDDPETQLLAQVPASGHELTLEALRVKEPGAAIGAGGDVVKLIPAIEMLRLDHAGHSTA